MDGLYVCLSKSLWHLDTFCLQRIRFGLYGPPVKPYKSALKGSEARLVRGNDFQARHSGEREALCCCQTETRNIKTLSSLGSFLTKSPNEMSIQTPHVPCQLKKARKNSPALKTSPLSENSRGLKAILFTKSDWDKSGQPLSFHLVSTFCNCLTFGWRNRKCALLKVHLFLSLPRAPVRCIKRSLIARQMQEPQLNLDTLSSRTSKLN